MSAKIFLSLGINYIPQKDFAVQETENGGITATQSFIIRKSDVGVGAALVNFRRGTRLEVLDPMCAALYRNLTVKDTPVSDSDAPGMMVARVTLTGYAYRGGGSSGEEQTVPTTSLRGNLEEAPLSQHKKWETMSDDEKWAIGRLLANDEGFVPSSDFSSVGSFEEYDARNTFYPAINNDGDPIVFGDDAKMFIKIIGEGDTTFKKPSWDYTVREESSTGFTGPQLNTLGKIVANPPGNPATPSSNYTWLSVGPSQDQSGPDRYIKDLPFMLIEDNDKTQFLYGS